MNIYDKTEDLAASIKAIGEYEDFLRCKKKISSDPRAVAMLREYRQYQIALEFAKMSGEGGRAQQRLGRFLHSHGRRYFCGRISYGRIQSYQDDAKYPEYSYG